MLRGYPGYSSHALTHHRPATYSVWSWTRRARAFGSDLHNKRNGGSVAGALATVGQRPGGERCAAGFLFEGSVPGGLQKSTLPLKIEVAS